MSELQNFNFEGSQVRTIQKDSITWFAAPDVTDVLGIQNTTQAVQKLDDDERSMFNIGRQGEVNFINEPGLYKLIGSSRKPAAKRFNRWVTHEVLPTIRKYGAYMTQEKIEEALLNPDTIINLAKQLKSEREGRLIAEQQVNELRPKATYYDRVLADKSLVTISIIAKDYGMSGRALNKKLHDLGVIYKQGNTWLLYATYQLTGWTHSDTTIVKCKDGTEKAVLNTKWTQKGRLGLYELLKQENILPLIEQDKTA
ncbi:MAG: phage antirepressor [Bacillota bacterium]|nr:phage antirepressor [Bacillota bacterium]